MRQWRQWVLVGALALGGFPGAAWAESEVEILLNKLVDKGVLSGVEAGQIRREISEGKEVRDKQVAKDIVPASARNWAWSGDIRLRNEYRNRIGTGTDINRQRIRFRYGFNAKVNDQLSVGARLATGSTSDPVSTNQSFSTSFNHKTFLLDRAYATYTPELPFLTTTKLTGGMFENPFWTVGALVWDDDLNFDGAAALLTKQLSPEFSLFSNNGLFSLQTDISEAASLWSTQGGFIFKPFATELENELRKNFSVTAAMAYHDYKNVTNPLSESTALTTAGGSKGNRSGIPDLNLLNYTVQAGSQYKDIPFNVFGDVVHNTAVVENQNGFQLGVRVGKARIPFDLRKGWEAGYFFERLEADATLGAFTDSDFGNGGTNHRGHVWWVQLATLKNSVLQLKYFNTQQVTGIKANADTFQADWVTKF